MISDALIAALGRVSPQAAQAIVAEAGRNHHQQRTQRAAAMPLWWAGGTPRTEEDE
jgi:hypothetical protein